MLTVPVMQLPAAATPATVGGPALATDGVVQATHTGALPPSATSASWLVADGESGAVLAAKDPHGKHPPASTQKVLTALTLLPRLDDRARVVVGSAADENIDGTRVGLVQGGKYPVKVLFECMLMVSGNDCANALARGNGGVGTTVAQMNGVAARLHADDTHAGTPDGLDAPGQSSSAYDLALIIRAAAKIPDFRAYNTRHEAVVPAVPPTYDRIGFVNKDKLLANYHGVVAAKNGFTDAAQQTFVTIVRRGDRTMIVSLMYGERYPVEMWRQAADLAEWGFRVPAHAKGVGVLVSPGTSAPKPRPVPSSHASGTSSGPPPSGLPSAGLSSPGPGSSGQAAGAPPRPSSSSSPRASSGGGSGWRPWLAGAGVVVVAALAGVVVAVRRRGIH